MGLELVELVLEIEDAFGISIPDEQFARMRTVGDLYDYLVANADTTSNRSVCLSAIAFYSLRRAAKSLGATERLRPRDPTERLLPESGRRKFWTDLQQVAELKLPPLRRPSWLVASGTVVSVIVALGAGLLVHHVINMDLVTYASVLATAVAVGLLFAVLTWPLAVLPAPHVKDLRALAESALGLNYSKLAERHRGGGANDVWVALRGIIVEQLEVSPDKVTPAADFVKDLGAG